MKFDHVAKACYYRYEDDPTYPGTPPNFHAHVANPSSSPNGSSEWVLDSGATNHVTNDLNNLSSFFNYEGHDTLQIGNGAGLPILHIGSSSLTLSSHTISLQNILHVSTFTKNLVSFSNLLHDNPQLIVELFSFYCSFKDHLTKSLILQVPCTNDLFSSSPNIFPPPQALLGVRVSADLWHARFWHPSSSTTLHLLHSNLPCTSHKLNSCHDCLMEKSHKLPFSPSLSTTSSPLELIHLDVWGPSPIVSFNEFRFYVIFVDDFTRYAWIFFMKQKSEVPYIFSCFKAQVENLFNSPLKLSVPTVLPNTCPSSNNSLKSYIKPLVLILLNKMASLNASIDTLLN